MVNTTLVVRLFVHHPNMVPKLHPAMPTTVDTQRATLGTHTMRPTCLTKLGFPVEVVKRSLRGQCKVDVVPRKVLLFGSVIETAVSPGAVFRSGEKGVWGLRGLVPRIEHVWYLCMND